MFYSFTEKVTKYCDKLGNWDKETGSTCQPDSKDELQVFGHYWDTGFPLNRTNLAFVSLHAIFTLTFSSVKEIPHFLRGAAGELTTIEATEDYKEKGSDVQKMIFENEKKCFEKMERDPPYHKSGTNPLRHYDPPTNIFLFYINMGFYVGQLYNKDTCEPFFVFIAAGLFCSRNWDGWLCWDDTPAGTYASQSCPNYFTDLDPAGEQG